jgi:predicted DNA binding CopG/RHH family protein
MSASRKKIPTFRNEDDERAFWAAHDSTELIDWSQGSSAILPKLKPTLRTISLRLPEGMIAELKILASKRDVPYQSLVKMFLADRIKEELEGARTAR